MDLRTGMYFLTEQLGQKEETSEISPREIYREQKTVMTIDQALDAEQKTVRLEEATGEVSGDYVYLYPPGIPILVPGEAIDVQTAETIRHCIRKGVELEGLPVLAAEVAEIFNVSSESAKIRIKQLGFDFAKSPVKQKTLFTIGYPSSVISL